MSSSLGGVVRQSRFRHVYGRGGRREQCYEGLRVPTGAGSSAGGGDGGAVCAVNPKFVAAVVEVAGGGAFQVPLT